jgi:hypothetical protein
MPGSEFFEHTPEPSTQRGPEIQPDAAGQQDTSPQIVETPKYREVMAMAEKLRVELRDLPTEQRYKIMKLLSEDISVEATIQEKKAILEGDGGGPNTIAEMLSNKVVVEDEQSGTLTEITPATLLEPTQKPVDVSSTPAQITPEPPIPEAEIVHDKKENTSQVTTALSKLINEAQTDLSDIDGITPYLNERLNQLTEVPNELLENIEKQKSLLMEKYGLKEEATTAEALEAYIEFSKYQDWNEFWNIDFGKGFQKVRHLFNLNSTKRGLTTYSSENYSPAEYSRIQQIFAEKLGVMLPGENEITLYKLVTEKGYSDERGKYDNFTNALDGETNIPGLYFRLNFDKDYIRFYIDSKSLASELSKQEVVTDKPTQ